MMLKNRIITLNNVVSELMKDDLIQISQVYSYKTTKFWKVMKNITVELSNGKIITIPKGFVTDGSTVPKFLWSIFPPYGDFLLAAIIHDYLYVERPFNFTRLWVDREMLIWSNKICNNKIDNTCRYIVAILLGWTFWNRYIRFNRKQKEI